MTVRSRISNSFANGQAIVKSTHRYLSTSTSRFPLRVASGRYEEGDRILVTYKDGKRVKLKLLSPLKADGKSTIGSHNSVLKHQDIIGKPSNRLYVDTLGSNGRLSSLRVSHPTLEQFVSLAPRTVTPIYASYSAFMTNLLDIHVDPPSENNNAKRDSLPYLEILEAGTGHGSLTLHLARAITAANPSPPSPSDSISNSDDIAQVWQAWKTKRRAIVHTVEYKPSRSRDAENIIRSFRGGLYWPHIDFHSGDVGKWVEDEIQNRKSLSTSSSDNGSSTGFLDIVCLDMPAVHKQIEKVYHAMKNHAQLLIYVPQITQLAACQQEIDRLQLPFKLDHAIELGEGISNGRVWDLRFIKPRAEQKLELEEDRSGLQSDTEGGNADLADVLDVNEESVSTSEEFESPTTAPAHDTNDFPTMVCRPMVGRLIMGGAFIGLWRKLVKP